MKEKILHLSNNRVFASRTQARTIIMLFKCPKFARAANTLLRVDVECFQSSSEDVC